MYISKNNKFLCNFNLSLLPFCCQKHGASCCVRFQRSSSVSPLKICPQLFQNVVLCWSLWCVNAKLPLFPHTQSQSPVQIPITILSIRIHILHMLHPERLGLAFLFVAHILTCVRMEATKRRMSVCCVEERIGVNLLESLNLS